MGGEYMLMEYVLYPVLNRIQIRDCVSWKFSTLHVRIVSHLVTRYLEMVVFRGRTRWYRFCVYLKRI